MSVSDAMERRVDVAIDGLTATGAAPLMWAARRMARVSDVAFDKLWTLERALPVTFVSWATQAQRERNAFELGRDSARSRQVGPAQRNARAPAPHCC